MWGVQVLLDGDTYAVAHSEYVWCTIAVKVIDEQGIVRAAAVSPRMELGCSEEPARDGALRSFRAWYAGGGYEVDLVRQDDAIALVRRSVGIGEPKGPPEVFVTLAVPRDAALRAEPTLETPYAWVDVVPGADSLALRLMSGDPPAVLAEATAPVRGCTPLVDPWDHHPDAKAAFRCASGVVYGRRYGPDAIAVLDERHALLAKVPLPERLRTDW